MSSSTISTPKNETEVHASLSGMNVKGLKPGPILLLCLAVFLLVLMWIIVPALVSTATAAEQPMLAFWVISVMGSVFIVGLTIAFGYQRKS